MLEAQENEIDGLTYQYTPLMLKPARALFDKLVQRFGPAIANAVEGLQGADLSDGMEIDEALGNVAGSAAGLLRGAVDGLDPKFHAELCDTLAKQTLVDVEGDGNMLPLTKVRDLLFGRKLLTEAKVVMWCLKVQYEDFLEPMQTLATTAIALRATAGSRSSSPKESTGLPIESPQAKDTATA